MDVNFFFTTSNCQIDGSRSLREHRISYNQPMSVQEFLQLLLKGFRMPPLWETFLVRERFSIVSV